MIDYLSRDALESILNCNNRYKTMAFRWLSSAITAILTASFYIAYNYFRFRIDLNWLSITFEVLFWTSILVLLAQILKIIRLGWSIIISILAGASAYIVYEKTKYAPEFSQLTIISYGILCTAIVLSVLASLNSVFLYWGNRLKIKLIPISKTKSFVLSIHDLLARIRLYRNRSKAFYYLIQWLVFFTVFMAASWAQWWDIESKAESAEPTSFLGIYFFLLAMEVFGVILTLALFREIKSERIEIPKDLFRVFHNAISEAEIRRDRPVIVHHIAPIPGLFQLLDESLHFPESPESSLVQVIGPWRKYLASFMRLSSQFRKNELNNAPRLVLSLVTYWKENSKGERIYKDSSLYHFAVHVCRSEIAHGSLLERARRYAHAIRHEYPKVTELGVIRYWYHTLVFELLKIVDQLVKEGQVQIFMREIAWPNSPDDWDREHLGFTFVVTSEEAYIGLPQIKSGEFRFEGRRIDFQHEAIRDLELLVRIHNPQNGKLVANEYPGSFKIGPTWAGTTSEILKGEIQFGDIRPSSESD